MISFAHSCSTNYLVFCVCQSTTVMCLSGLFLMPSSNHHVDVSTQSSMQSTALVFWLHYIYRLRHQSDVKPWVWLSTFLTSGLFIWVPSLSFLNIFRVYYCQDVYYLMKFLQQSLVWWSSRVFLWNSFLIFVSTPLVWWFPLPFLTSSCNFRFLQEFWCFLDLAVIFPLLIFPHFIMYIELFSMLNIIPTFQALYYFYFSFQLFYFL